MLQLFIMNAKIFTVSPVAFINRTVRPILNTSTMALTLLPLTNIDRTIIKLVRSKLWKWGVTIFIFIINKFTLILKSFSTLLIQKIGDFLDWPCYLWGRGMRICIILSIGCRLSYICRGRFVVFWLTFFCGNSIGFTLIIKSLCMDIYSKFLSSLLLFF